MLELVRSVAAGALWLAPLMLILFSLNKRYARRPTFLPGLMVAFPAFYFLQVIIPKILSVAGALNLWTVTLIWFGLTITGMVWYRVQRPVIARGTDMVPNDDTDKLVTQIAMISSCVVLFALLVYSLVTPVHVWDVLAYHMPMVSNYVQNESLEPWPTQDLRQVYRVNGAELQMMILALLSRSDAWMELPNIIALLVGLVAVREIARQTLRKDVMSYLAVVLVLTAPQIVLGAVTAKNDVVFMTLALCGLYWMIRVAESESSPLPAAVMAALCGALALATKVMGLNVVATMTLGLVLLLGLKRSDLRTFAVFCVSSLVFAIVLIGDVVWANFSRGGSPVGIAPGEVQFTVGLANFAAALKLYVYELGFKRLLLPQTADHDFSHFGYFFPLILVLGVFVGIRQLMTHKRSETLPIVAFFAFVLFLSAIVARVPIQWDQRFMIWMVPVFGLLALSTIQSCRPRILLATISFCAAFAIGNTIDLLSTSSAGIFVKSANHLIRYGALPRMSDVSTSEALIKTAGFDVRTKIVGFEVLDRLASGADSVLYVGAEDSWMYPAWGPRFTRHVSGVSDARDTREKASSGQFRFIVVEGDAGPSLQEAAHQGMEGRGYEVITDGWGRAIYQLTNRRE